MKIYRDLLFLSPENMMIERQAQRITELNKIISDLERRVNRLQSEIENRHKAGGFYLELQKAILDNPTLQAEWSRFLVILRLSGAKISDMKTSQAFLISDELAVKDDIHDSSI